MSQNDVLPPILFNRVIYRNSIIAVFAHVLVKRFTRGDIHARFT